MALTAAELRVVVSAAVKDAVTDLNKVGTAVDQTGKQAGTAGTAWSNVSKGVVAGSAALGAGFSIAVVQGAEFEQQLANINTVARLSESDTTALGDALQQMSRDTGQSTEQLTQSMYDMVSAGTITSEQLSQDLPGAMKTIEAASMLAVGGMGSLAGTTDLLTSALNAYGLESTDATKVTDIFAVAIEKGKVTAEEIGASLSNVAPIAATAGISLEEIAASYATLTANGVPAAEASTQMRAAIVALLSPNERLKDLMADTGIEFAKVAEEKGLQVAMQQLRDATDAVGDAFQIVSDSGGDFAATLKEQQKALGLTNTEVEKLIAVAGKDGAAAAVGELNTMVAAGDSGLSDVMGRVEGFNYLLQTTGENSETFGENYTAAMDATGTASEQAEIAMAGPAEAAKRLTANFMTWMQDVGGPFAGTMGPMLMMFNSLTPAIGGMIKPAQAVGGLIGGVVGKAFMGLTGILGTVGTTIWTTVIPAVWAMITPFLPVIAIVAAVIAVGALLYLAWTNNFLGIQDIVATVWDWISKTFQSIVAGVQHVISVIGGWVGNVQRFVVSVVQTIATLPGKVMAFFGQLWTNVSTWFANLVVSAGQWALNTVTSIVSFYLGLPGKIIGAIGGLIGLLVGFFRGLPGLIWDTIAGAGESIVRGLWSGITGLAGWLWNKIKGFVGGILNNVLGFFGIRSPSTVFAGIGAQLMRGLAMGIQSASSEATGALSGVTARLQGVMDRTDLGTATVGVGIGGASAVTAQDTGMARQWFGSTPEYRTDPSASGGGGGGVTVILQTDRFMGTKEEGAYYANKIAADLRSRMK